VKDLTKKLFIIVCKKFNGDSKYMYSETLEFNAYQNRKRIESNRKLGEISAEWISNF